MLLRKISSAGLRTPLHREGRPDSDRYHFPQLKPFNLLRGFFVVNQVQII